jgi:hypothetical protein
VPLLQRERACESRLSTSNSLSATRVAKRYSGTCGDVVQFSVMGLDLVLLIIARRRRRGDRRWATSGWWEGEKARDPGEVGARGSAETWGTDPEVGKATSQAWQTHRLALRDRGESRTRLAGLIRSPLLSATSKGWTVHALRIVIDKDITMLRTGKQ